MTGAASAVYAMFEAQRRGNGQYASLADQLSPQQVAEQEASFLMDRVAAGELASWDAIRPELADLLQRAGCGDAAKFVHTATVMAN